MLRNTYDIVCCSKQKLYTSKYLSYKFVKYRRSLSHECNVYCISYNVQCILYIVQCIFYIVLCILYIIQCTLYNVYCIMYTKYAISDKKV